MTDRIKLAEAMKIEYWRSEVYGDAIGVPDPFTDANDDYAVLGWMRESHLWAKFKQELYSLRDTKKVSHKWMVGRYTWSYQIGDYARAALKVLDD